MCHSQTLVLLKHSNRYDVAQLSTNKLKTHLLLNLYWKTLAVIRAGHTMLSYQRHCQNITVIIAVKSQSSLSSHNIIKNTVIVEATVSIMQDYCYITVVSIETSLTITFSHISFTAINTTCYHIRSHIKYDVTGIYQEQCHCHTSRELSLVKISF